jgi:predicted TIM-barrel fold metal-dependent hydrolase
MSPGFRLPPLTCDVHAHVFGPFERFPLVTPRLYDPPEVSAATWQTLHRELGVERGVLIQPSVHGTDSGAMLAGVAALGAGYRAIAVPALDASDGELAKLNDGGVRGVRFSMMPGAIYPLAALERVVSRSVELGWHTQLLLEPEHLVALEARIATLPGTIVIDHFGRCRVADGVAAPGFLTLRRLARRENVWVKLSGAYALSPGLPPFDDVAPLARALVEDGAENLLWGTDFPYPNQKPERCASAADHLRMIASWMPTAELRQRILVDNPALLFGF